MIMHEEARTFMPPSFLTKGQLRYFLALCVVRCQISAQFVVHHIFIVAPNAV
jgi:hypothetical protein